MLESGAERTPPAVVACAPRGALMPTSASVTMQRQAGSGRFMRPPAVVGFQCGDAPTYERYMPVVRWHGVARGRRARRALVLLRESRHDALAAVRPHGLLSAMYATPDMPRHRPIPADAGGRAPEYPTIGYATHGERCPADAAHAVSM